MEKEFTEGDAFVAAYSEYFGVVYKEALKYSGNHHIAEEIAQDAFFTAYIQCGSESKQQIKIWMLMFARYRAMNYIRDHKREVPLAEITMADDRYPNSLILYAENLPLVVSLAYFDIKNRWLYIPPVFYISCKRSY